MCTVADPETSERGPKKYETQADVFVSHLFIAIIYRPVGGGGVGMAFLPLPLRIRYW